MNNNIWLIESEGPEVFGPFADEDAAEAEAKQLGQEQGINAFILLDVELGKAKWIYV